MAIRTEEQLIAFVQETVRLTPVADIHTHLFAESFGDLLLWGVDDLLTYHYLIAEMFRFRPDLSYDDFWRMSKTERADLIWQTLFIDHSPYSEACRGVVTVLNRLGFDLSTRDLESYRAYFREVQASDYIDRILELAGVKTVVMTNDPFDDYERERWSGGGSTDPRFLAALRIDPLLNGWDSAYMKLQQQGYAVTQDFSGDTAAEVRRFLHDWIGRMNPLYMAVSLPNDFAYPEPSLRGRVIDECILPVAEEAGIPFALMIGVKRKVNPSLKDAGDSLGYSDIGAVERIVSGHPNVKFLVTMLSRENQHELAVTARKNRNLLIFGCWWFLNNPSLIEEITRMRLELLGGSVIPQHSDCRVLDQLLYKWDHSRTIIAKVLGDKYTDLLRAGWRLEEDEIRRDVEGLLGGAFWTFLGKPDPSAK
ncbi:glucuronate isomerase [Paenibacillus validus]|uniref:glucuronate isomerase n=1 Tax=Paenibacillus validus TaxID=44253 RepID=UPI000FDB76BF|nr:glucuronate isomerase [Paenibacillus validus]MED4603779.1 glucuronate isomerase [Paenibacillus validus]MED4606838.1 glucuronate isomerase [Paenibacillus validus]